MRIGICRAGLVLALCLLVGCQPYRYYGTLLEPAKALNDFTMETDTGSEFRLSEQSKPLILYFGYTHCPDVCPTTMYHLREAMQKLGSDGEKVQVGMITVDPKRDTQEIMHHYVTNFDPTFIGLREDNPDRLATVMSDFGVYAEKGQDSAPGANDYPVTHSSHIFVVDQSGMRLLISDDATADEIASDIREYLRSQ